MVFIQKLMWLHCVLECQLGKTRLYWIICCSAWHIMKSRNSVLQDCFSVQFSEEFPVSGISMRLGGKIDMAPAWQAQV